MSASPFPILTARVRVGTIPNDQTGDNFRDASIKANGNFDFYDAAFTNVASNLSDLFESVGGQDAKINGKIDQSELTLALSGKVDNSALTPAIDSALGPALAAKLETDFSNLANPPAALDTLGAAKKDATALTGTGTSQGFSVYRGTTPYEGSQGYLGEGGTNNFAKAAQNLHSIFRGTAAAPDTTASYARTAAFIEHHCATIVDHAIAVWGNPYKVGALTVEFIAETGMQAEGCAINGRAYSPYSPTSTDQFKNILVGGAFIAQTNPGANNGGYDTFGLNVISARTSGLPGANTVGIECDILLNTSVPALAPGMAGANNATAYWAQAGNPGIVCNTAFLITDTGPATTGGQPAGWLFGLYSAGAIYDHLIQMKNTINAPSARGARFETTWNAPDGRILECFVNGNENFRVSGDSQNPLSGRIGGSFANFQIVARQNLVDGDFVVVARY